MKRDFDGRFESEVFDEFMNKDNWIATSSDEGWWRVLNWKTGLSLEVQYDIGTGIIYSHCWAK